MSKNVVISKRLGEARKAELLALRLRDQVAEKALEMGGVLNSIHTRELHKALGYTSFETWIKDRLNISVRSAWYMIGWHKKQEMLDLSPKILEGIGTSKLKLILSSRVQTKEDVSALANTARSNTIESLRRKTGLSSSIHKNVTIPNSSIATWDKAISLIRNDNPDQFLNESQAIIQIMNEFVRFHRAMNHGAA